MSEESKSDAYTTIDEAGIAEEKKSTDRLVSWLEENGCRMPNLYFQYYAVDFRGVHINADIKNNVCILEVAPKCLITTELARKSEIGMRITRSGCRLRSTHSYVACYILWERAKGEKSYWKPYIDMFPKSYRHMPMMFNAEELHHLKGSLCIPELNERKRNYAAEYQNILSHVPEFAQFTELDFFWARLVVLTRIFGITYKGKKTSAMVPMADMLNHKRPPDTYWTFDPNVNAFTITTTKDFVSGEQVYDSYGCKCNTVFFMNYGFVADNNKWNETKITLAIPDGDPLYNRKLNIVGSFSAQAYKVFQIPTDYEQAYTQEAFSYMRVAMANEAELNQLMGGEDYYRPNTRKIRQINIRNEREVLKGLSACAQERMLQFDTTIEMDTKLLEDESLSMYIQNCIKCRRCEKEVLQYYIDLERILLEALDEKNTCNQAKTLLTDHKDIPENTHIRHYVTHVILPLLETNADDTIGYLIGQFAYMRVTERKRATAQIESNPLDVVKPFL